MSSVPELTREAGATSTLNAGAWLKISGEYQKLQRRETLLDVVVNQGGFYASLLLVVAIGLILDWRTPGSSTAYTPEAFQWAMSFQYVLWALGLTQVWRYRRRTRAWLRVHQPDWVALHSTRG